METIWKNHLHIAALHLLRFQHSGTVFVNFMICSKCLHHWCQGTCTSKACKSLSRRPRRSSTACWASATLVTFLALCLGAKWCKSKVRTRHSASCAASFSIQHLSVGDFLSRPDPPPSHCTFHDSQLANHQWQVRKESEPCWAWDPISIMFRFVCSLPLQL